MKLIIEEEEIIEIKPVDETTDRGVVINPTIGKRHEGESELVKEITALDALQIGPSGAAIINQVPQSSASRYKDGKDFKDEDVRARILSKKFDIQDVAVTKLMETLGTINPEDLEKTSDKVMVLNSLTKLVDMGSTKDDKGGLKVELHLYAPNQKKETDYKTIDV